MNSKDILGLELAVFVDSLDVLPVLIIYILSVYNVHKLLKHMHKDT
jgi:hypothetical protein